MYDCDSIITQSILNADSIITRSLLNVDSIITRSLLNADSIIMRSPHDSQIFFQYNMCENVKIRTPFVFPSQSFPGK